MKRKTGSFLRRFRRYAGIYDEHQRCRTDQNDGRKVFRGVEFDHALGQRRIDCECGGREQNGVTVGRRFGDGIRAYHAACSGTVVDDERLSELLAQHLGQDPGLDVGGAAGGKRHDDAHRPGGKGLSR